MPIYLNMHLEKQKRDIKRFDSFMVLILVRCFVIIVAFALIYDEAHLKVMPLKLNNTLSIF